LARLEENIRKAKALLREPKAKPVRREEEKKVAMEMEEVYGS